MDLILWNYITNDQLGTGRKEGGAWLALKDELGLLDALGVTAVIQARLALIILNARRDDHYSLECECRFNF